MRFAPVVVRRIHCMGDASKLATAIDLQCYDLLSERGRPQMLGSSRGLPA